MNFAMRKPFTAATLFLIFPFLPQMGSMRLLLLAVVGDQETELLPHTASQILDSQIYCQIFQDLQNLTYLFTFKSSQSEKSHGLNFFI